MSPEALIRLGVKITVGAALLAVLTAIFMAQNLPIIVAFMNFAAGLALIFSPSQRLAIEACAEPVGKRVAIFSCGMGAMVVMGSRLSSILKHQNTTPLALLILVSVVIILFIRKVF